jgi:hypothetical protein
MHLVTASITTPVLPHTRLLHHIKPLYHHTISIQALLSARLLTICLESCSWAVVDSLVPVDFASCPIDVTTHSSYDSTFLGRQQHALSRRQGCDIRLHAAASLSEIKPFLSHCGKPQAPIRLQERTTDMVQLCIGFRRT